MRPGSVIVDLAVQQGGNCELSAPGETVVREGVTIIETGSATRSNFPSRSSMAAKSRRLL